MGKQAFCTLVYTDSYVHGALALAGSLLRLHGSPTADGLVPTLAPEHSTRQAVTASVHQLADIPVLPRYPSGDRPAPAETGPRLKARPALVALVGPGLKDESLALLAVFFDQVVPVPEHDSRDAAALQLLGRPELGGTFAKIEAWNLTEYDTVVFLDADTLVLRPLDCLFAAPLVPDVGNVAAAPDIGWPDCFNSGVVVLRPSASTYGSLLARAAEAGASFDGGDQGLLNDYFLNWQRLSYRFNVVPTEFYSYSPALRRYIRDISVVHFIGATKPWNKPRPSTQDQVDAASSPSEALHLLLEWWLVYQRVVEPVLRAIGHPAALDDVLKAANIQALRARAAKHGARLSGPEAGGHGPGGSNGGLRGGSLATRPAPINLHDQITRSIDQSAAHLQQEILRVLQETDNPETLFGRDSPLHGGLKLLATLLTHSWAPSDLEQLINSCPTSRERDEQLSVILAAVRIMNGHISVAGTEAGDLLSPVGGPNRSRKPGCPDDPAGAKGKPPAEKLADLLSMIPIENLQRQVQILVAILTRWRVY